MVRELLKALHPRLPHQGCRKVVYKVLPWLCRVFEVLWRIRVCSFMASVPGVALKV